MPSNFGYLSRTVLGTVPYPISIITISQYLRVGQDSCIYYFVMCKPLSSVSTFHWFAFSMKELNYEPSEFLDLCYFYAKCS